MFGGLILRQPGGRHGRSMLEKISAPRISRRKIATADAKLAYRRFREIFYEPFARTA
jgi:hypothetical protein